MHIANGADMKSPIPARTCRIFTMVADIEFFGEYEEDDF